MLAWNYIVSLFRSRIFKPDLTYVLATKVLSSKLIWLLPLQLKMIIDYTILDFGIKYPQKSPEMIFNTDCTLKNDSKSVETKSYI